MWQRSRRQLLMLELPDDVLEQYGYAVQLIAGADGQLDKREINWLLDEARSRGVSEKIIDAWARFDWSAHRAGEFVASLKSSLPSRYARLLIYDAIRVARADGRYPLEERDAVFESASLLSISAGTVRALEALVSMEESVAEFQIALFDSE